MKAQLGLAALLWLQAPSGSLLLEAPPGAVVIWDGADLGEVGAAGLMRIEEIPPGDYSLRLTRNLRVVFSDQVVIRPGPQRLQVAGTGRPVPVSEPAGSVAPVPAPTVQEPDPFGEPPPAIPPAPGSEAAQERFLDDPSEPKASAATQPDQGFSTLDVLVFFLAAVALLLLWRRVLASGNAVPPGTRPPREEDARVAPHYPVRTRAQLQLPGSPSRNSFLDELRRREEAADRPPSRASRGPADGEVEIEVVLHDDPSDA